jgi:hypothetical protein
MLDCLAFIALAELQPSFTQFPRGSARLESGVIAGQPVNDTRIFLKAMDGAHFYLVESDHGPVGRYVEKVPQQTLAKEFCDIMDVHFTQQTTSQWTFAGVMNELPITGMVDISKSYFHNHVWVDVETLLRLEVLPLPVMDISTLNLTNVSLCQASVCGEEEDLTDLKR